MKKVSSKYLNLHTLDSIVKTDPSYDSVILLTSFGYIIGELNICDSETSNNVSSIISKFKSNIAESFENDAIEFIGDGSMLTINNAIVKYPNNTTLNFYEFTVHCEDVIGFAPINKESVLNQLP